MINSKVIFKKVYFTPILSILTNHPSIWLGLAWQCPSSWHDMLVMAWLTSCHVRHGMPRHGLACQDMHSMLSQINSGSRENSCPRNPVSLCSASCQGVLLIRIQTPLKFAVTSFQTSIEGFPLFWCRLGTFFALVKVWWLPSDGFRARDSVPGWVHFGNTEER
jgi:hypothetical protein